MTHSFHLETKKVTKKRSHFLFHSIAMAVKTNRDAWVYNFYNESLVKNMKESIRLYMEGLKDYKIRSQGVSKS